MNVTQSFEEFSSQLSTMDLALYAGLGLILWVLFKDKFSPVQEFISNLTGKVTNSSPLVNVQPVCKKNNDDVFFQLVTSWKQTRDLAVKSNCAEAVKVADQMFPFLSPTVCQSTNEANKE